MHKYYNDQMEALWNKESLDEEDVYDADNGIAKSMTDNELNGSTSALLRQGN